PLPCVAPYAGSSGGRVARTLRAHASPLFGREDRRRCTESLTSCEVTPSGIERGRNVTGARSVTATSTDRAALERPAAMPDCNECNEALDVARAAITVARRLALVALNALVNGDAHRAHAALQDLRDATSSSATPNAAPALRRP